MQIVGRLKDQIIRGGINVPVAQVEDALLRPRGQGGRAGRRSGQPDGEKGCAFVVSMAKTPTLEELTRFLRNEGVAPPLGVGPRD